MPQTPCPAAAPHLRRLALTLALALGASVALSAVAAVAQTAPGDAPRLSLPLECTLDQTCFIQNAFDRDPGPGVRDHGCGALSYDGHRGTDFALPSLAAMRAGVDVRAAAPGRVTGTRDGEEDGAFLTGADLGGRDCGNGVMIDHGNGWRTQYCHLARGSITVRPGTTVARGAVLGRVGLSGRSEFPHVHLSVFHGETRVDPFAPDAAEACDPAARGLWDPPLPYRPGGLIAVGITPFMPDYDTVKAGPPAAATLPAKAPVLVLWAHAFGARAGDEIALELAGPSGVLVRNRESLPRAQARFFRAAGKRNPGGAQGWPAGIYSGTVQLLRAGQILERRAIRIRIEG